MKLRFVESKNVTDDVKSFIFEPEAGLSWKAGQYMHYLFPHSNEDDRGHERWFTNSAAPFEKHIIISTRIASEKVSSFKHALASLKPGDEIEADGPEGDFTVEDQDRNYIFVAGGIGITPFRSILAEADHQRIKLKATLLYANRNSDVTFKDELEQFAAHNPNLKIKYLIDPEKIDQQLLKEQISAVENPYVYVSGPEPMVKGLAAQLEQLGFAKENIKTDDFPGYDSY